MIHFHGRCARKGQQSNLTQFGRLPTILFQRQALRSAIQKFNDRFSTIGAFQPRGGDPIGVLRESVTLFLALRGIWCAVIEVERAQNRLSLSVARGVL